MKKFLILLVILSALTGCATVRTWVDENPVTARLALTIAADAVFAEHKAWAKPAVSIITLALSELAGTEETKLDTLETFVAEQIEWEKLTVSEEALLRGFIGAVKVETVKYLERSGVSDARLDTVRLAQVLEWIRSAAERQVEME